VPLVRGTISQRCDGSNRETVYPEEEPLSDILSVITLMVELSKRIKLVSVQPLPARSRHNSRFP